MAPGGPRSRSLRLGPAGDARPWGSRALVLGALVVALLGASGTPTALAQGALLPAADAAPGAAPRLLSPSPSPRSHPALRLREGWPPRWPRQPLARIALEAIGALEVRRAAGPTGRGALLCVIDTGIDLGHRDFLDARGATRIRWLLDLDGSARGLHPELEARFGGGVWAAPEIDAARAAGARLPEDWHGHGTALASIAAGDDGGVGELPGPEAGVAPEATLLVVRALRRGARGFEDADVSLGARFCEAVASSAPEGLERLVILLGLGGHDGAHDGGDPLERELSRLAEAGALVVAAAGNDGDRPVHALAQLSPAVPLELPLWIPTPAPSLRERFVSILLLPQPAGLGADAGGLSPDAPRLDALQIRMAAGDWSEPFSGLGQLEWRSSGGFVRLERFEEAGGTRTYVIFGEDAATSLHGGELRLRLLGQGRIDAWLLDAELGFTLSAPRFEGAHAQPGGGVSIPATASGVLAIGASVERASLETAAGRLETHQAPGEIAAYSARGPLPNGVPKPELHAPGGWMAAARSSALLAGDPENLFGGLAALHEARRIGEDRLALRGSSFSAALVAGAGLLALEAGGSAERVRASLLCAGGGASPWEPAAGSGRLWLPALLESIGGGGGAAETLSLVATRPRPHPGEPTWLVARSLDARGGPAADPLRLVLPDGTELRSRPGAGWWAWPLRAPPPGAGPRRYRVRAGALERGLDLPASGGGGCAISRPSGPGSPNSARRLYPGSLALPALFVLLVLLVLLALSRRPRLRDRGSPETIVRSRRCRQRPAAGSRGS
ncbi:MAG: S8 family serine peptidase [Myxococcales bacterium]|nr:S8 family serine peptidase [Myxococcales bacterium]